jgi:hypothetical protein
MKFTPIISASCLLLMLPACVTLPPYKAPSKDDPNVAIVDVSRIPSGSICTGGVLYTLGNMKTKDIPVPTNSRAGVYSFVYIAEYQVSYSCQPGISFQPEPGKHYLMNLEIQDQKCNLEVYEKSDANRTGLQLVPKIGPPEYCR